MFLTRICECCRESRAAKRFRQLSQTKFSKVCNFCVEKMALLDAQEKQFEELKKAQMKEEEEEPEA